jgi:two-component system cell cycle sensor histidine kinase/response regulator CckA
MIGYDEQPAPVGRTTAETQYIRGGNDTGAIMIEERGQRVNYHLRNIALVTTAIAAYLALSCSVVFSDHPKTLDFSPEEINYLQSHGPIVFVSQSNYPPFEFLQKDGSMDGVCIELARWMSTEMGFKTRFLSMSFQQAQQAVLSGQADVITSLFHSDKRAESFDFSEPLFDVPASIFVKGERPDIARLEDLMGKRIAIQRGDYARDFLESKGIFYDLIPTEDFAQATNAVLAGRADALIGDEQIVLYHLFSNRLTTQAKKVGTPLYIGKNCIATKKGNAVLHSILAKSLRHAREQGVIDGISRKWLGTGLTGEQSRLARWMPLIFMGSAVLMVIALAIVAWNIRLRHLVETRTRELSANEQRFRSYVENVNDIVFSLTTAGVFAYVSPNWTETFGYELDETIGQPFAPFVHPDDIPQCYAFLQKVLETGEKQSGVEYRVRHKNGTWLWYTANGSLIREADGSTVSFIGIGRDISERKQAEELLRSSEERFSTAFRATPDAVNLTTLIDGTYLEVNEGFTDMTGYLPEEVIGRSSIDLGIWVDPEDRARLVRELKDHGIVKSLEAQFRRRDGSIFVGQMSARSIEMNGEPCLLSVTRDITQHKEAERALSENEDMLKSLMELMPVGIGWAGNNGRIEYLNRSFVERFGYTVSDIPTIEQWSLNAYPDPEYRESLANRWKTQLDNALEHGIPPVPLDAMVTCKDGTVRHAILNTQIANNRIIAIFTDITERENIQKELLKIQKLESLGVLAGGIAHDFNNILTGILGNISFARMFLDESHRASKILQEAEKASQRATDLAHQLLTFAKGSQPVKKAVFARHVMEASASLVLRGSNVINVIQASDDLHAIEVDEGQISQAFNNIFINAAHAMPGGGTITITAENFTLDGANLMLLPAGEYVKITVTDTGCGISNEDQKRIFDPYFTTKTGGSGLGLASVHSIISKHGGHISVRSMVGKGTTFDILLPASPQQAPEPEEDMTIVAAGEQRSGSLLVMDDEEMIRDMTAEILGEYGYHVQTCGNGEDAIALYKAAKEAGVPFSAVIMDLTIPGGMGGKETARHILDIDPHALLVVSSGYSNDPVVAEYAQFGFSAMIAKPYKATEIVQVLSGLLSAPSRIPD